MKPTSSFNASGWVCNAFFSAFEAPCRDLALLRIQRRLGGYNAVLRRVPRPWESVCPGEGSLDPENTVLKEVLMSLRVRLMFCGEISV